MLSNNTFRARLARLFAPSSASRAIRTPQDKELGDYDVEQIKSRVERYRGFMADQADKRRELYEVYEELDNWPEVSGVLDAYAEEATQEDPDSGLSIWVEAPDEGIQSVLNTCLENLEINDEIYAIIRDSATLGDLPARVHGEPGVGVTAVEWKHPRNYERVETEDGTLLGHFYDDTGLRRSWDVDDLEELYKPWDFVHIRLRRTTVTTRDRERDTRELYGTSILKNTQRPLKQVRTASDMLMVYRLSNTLDRRNIMVDVGTRSTEMEMFQKLGRWKAAMRRTVYKNPDSGEFDVMWNPLGLTEDLIWPTWDGSQSRIETTPGMPNIYAAYDMDLFYDQLYASMRAKKEWFGFGESAEEGGRAFSWRSVQFGRQASRLQRDVMAGISRILQIHLALLDLSVSKGTFKVCMVPPSPIELLQRLEVMQTTLDVIERSLDVGTALGLRQQEWGGYLLKSLLGFSDDEIERFGPIQDVPGEGPDLGGSESPAPVFAEPEQPGPEPEEPEDEVPEEPGPGPDYASIMKIIRAKPEDLTEDVTSTFKKAVKNQLASETSAPIGKLLNEVFRRSKVMAAGQKEPLPTRLVRGEYDRRLTEAKIHIRPEDPVEPLQE